LSDGRHPDERYPLSNRGPMVRIGARSIREKACWRVHRRGAFRALHVKRRTCTSACMDDGLQAERVSDTNACTARKDTKTQKVQCKRHGYKPLSSGESQIATSSSGIVYQKQLAAPVRGCCCYCYYCCCCCCRCSCCCWWQGLRCGLADGVVASTSKRPSPEEPSWRVQGRLQYRRGMLQCRPASDQKAFQCATDELLKGMQRHHRER